MPGAFRRDEFQSRADFCHGIFLAIGLQRAMLTTSYCPQSDVSSNDLFVTVLLIILQT
jgi:hypothetical protein